MLQLSYSCVLQSALIVGCCLRCDVCVPCCLWYCVIAQDLDSHALDLILVCRIWTMPLKRTHTHIHTYIQRVPYTPWHALRLWATPLKHTYHTYKHIYTHAASAIHYYNTLWHDPCIWVISTQTHTHTYVHTYSQCHTQPPHPMACPVSLSNTIWIRITPSSTYLHRWCSMLSASSPRVCALYMNSRWLYVYVYMYVCMCTHTHIHTYSVHPDYAIVKIPP